MDELDLADYREMHVAGADWNPKACRSCGEPWPCRAVQLMDEVDELRAALAEIRGQSNDSLARHIAGQALAPNATQPRQ